MNKKTDSYFDKLKLLQSAGDKYVIIECGNGACVANSVMSVPGASAMLLKSMQPYSRESQEELIGPYKRSVSIDSVARMMGLYEGPIVVTQFQLQGTDAKVLTHGYIGVRGKFGQAIYHISFYGDIVYEPDYPGETLLLEVETRNMQFQSIRDAVIEMMTKHSVDETTQLNNLYIDGVFDLDGNCDFETTLTYLGTSEIHDTFIPYMDNKWQRFEDFARDSDGLILLRGSFNPLHTSHVNMIEEASAAYPTYKKTFLISLHNFDKAPLAAIEAIERAKFINSKGFNVVFSCLPYFNDSSNFINNRYPNLPVIYPVGLDTINRFIDDIVDKDKKCLESFIAFDKKYGRENLNVWTEESLKTSWWHTFQKESWKNAKFLVFDRKDKTINPLALKYFNDYISVNTNYKDELGISSTKIRNGEQLNTI